MLSDLVYWWIFRIVWIAFAVFASILLLRLFFNYADPNPFGAVGRFGYKIKKLTEKWIYPSARFLATFRIDPRLAPILTLLVSLVITYFAMSIVHETFRVIDKFGQLTDT